MWRLVGVFGSHAQADRVVKRPCGRKAADVPAKLFAERSAAASSGQYGVADCTPAIAMHGERSCDPLRDLEH